MRKTPALLHARCDVSHNNLTYWFHDLKDYLGEVKEANILEDTGRIYNCDRTGFPYVPKMKKVITLKHGKHVYQGGTALNQMQIAVLLAASDVA